MTSLGWFGDPWLSYICYSEDDTLRSDARVAFPPAGTTCLHCAETIQAGDSGELMLVSRALRFIRVYAHKECQLLTVLGGSLAGLDTARGTQVPPLSKRQEAVATWDWVLANGTDAALAAAS